MSATLCVIRGCRIRSQHLPDCDDDTCKGCLPRTADAGYACDPDVNRTRDRLHTITELAPDARLVAAGLVRRGAGRGSNKPGSRSPGNDDAQDTLDEIQHTLTALIDHIGVERGTPRPWFTTPGDLLVIGARWLVSQLEWLRHRPDVDQAFTDIREAAGRLRSMLDGPTTQKFFGPCRSTITWDDDGQPHDLDQPCTGDVYGRPDAEEATCRTCRARWKTADRRAWLDGKVRDHAFTAAAIAEAYGVHVKTIRSWADRGKLLSYWRTEAGLVTPWVDPELDETLKGEALKARLGEISDEIQARGGRLHYVGEVLDLAAADAARRETERAKRERRAAQRAAEQAAETEDERLSA